MTIATGQGLAGSSLLSISIGTLRADGTGMTINATDMTASDTRQTSPMGGFSQWLAAQSLGKDGEATASPAGTVSQRIDAWKGEAGGFATPQPARAGPAGMNAVDQPQSGSFALLDILEKGPFNGTVAALAAAPAMAKADSDAATEAADAVATAAGDDDTDEDPTSAALALAPFVPIDSRAPASTVGAASLVSRRIPAMTSPNGAALQPSPDRTSLHAPSSDLGTDSATLTGSAAAPSDAELSANRPTESAIRPDPTTKQASQQAAPQNPAMSRITAEIASTTAPGRTPNMGTSPRAGIAPLAPQPATAAAATANPEIRPVTPARRDARVETGPASTLSSQSKDSEAPAFEIARPVLSANDSAALQTLAHQPTGAPVHASGAASTSATMPHVPINFDGSFVDTMSDHLALTAQSGGIMRLQINPEHLGRIDIAMMAGADSNSITLVTEHDRVRETLQAAQTRLEHDMRQAGHKPVEVSVELRQNNQSGSGASQQQQSGQQGAPADQSGLQQQTRNPEPPRNMRDGAKPDMPQAEASGSASASDSIRYA